MSNRIPIIDNLCKNPANHKFHMCELKLAGKKEKVKKMQINPTFICGNCGNISNDEGGLCAPGPMHS